MTRFTSTLAAILLTASVSAASAQTPAGAAAPGPASSAPTQLTVPRVDLGGGFTSAIPLSTDGEGFFLAPMVNARVGVALNPRWALEGAFDTWPASGDALIVYRAQARWLFGGAAAPGRLQPHLTFGGAGGIEHETWGPYQWRDAAGTIHQEPRVSRWNVMPPIFPTVGIGFQKTLGGHVALRADVAAIVMPADDFIGVLLMPSVSVSIPIGRYATTRPR